MSEITGKIEEFETDVRQRTTICTFVFLINNKSEVRLPFQFQIHVYVLYSFEVKKIGCMDQNPRTVEKFKVVGLVWIYQGTGKANPAQFYSIMAKFTAQIS